MASRDSYGTEGEDDGGREGKGATMVVTTSDAAFTDSLILAQNIPPSPPPELPLLLLLLVAVSLAEAVVAVVFGLVLGEIAVGETVACCPVATAVRSFLYSAADALPLLLLLTAEENTENPRKIALAASIRMSPGSVVFSSASLLSSSVCAS